MTEKRFEYKNHKVFDNLTGETHSSNMVSVNVLNELHEENNELRLQLNLCSDQRNEFHRGARENANRVGKLEKENEELKSENLLLKSALSLEEVESVIGDEKRIDIPVWYEFEERCDCLINRRCGDS